MSKLISVFTAVFVTSRSLKLDHVWIYFDELSFCTAFRAYVTIPSVAVHGTVFWSSTALLYYGALRSVVCNAQCSAYDRRTVQHSKKGSAPVVHCEDTAVHMTVGSATQ